MTVQRTIPAQKTYPPVRVWECRDCHVTEFQYVDETDASETKSPEIGRPNPRP